MKRILKHFLKKKSLLTFDYGASCRLSSEHNIFRCTKRLEFNIINVKFF